MVLCDVKACKTYDDTRKYKNVKNRHYFLGSLCVSFFCPSCFRKKMELKRRNSCCTSLCEIVLLHVFSQEWDREQLTKKESVPMKVKQSEIEAAVKETDKRRLSRWQPAKITLGKGKSVHYCMCFCQK